MKIATIATPVVVFLARALRGTGMFVLSTIGGLFSAVTLGIIAAAISVGGVLWMYGRDLPNHEQLAQYTPPTISRIYSGEGRLMDEFARERRLFAPAEEIPDLVKQAFISAEDKNFYRHAGYDPVGMVAAAVDAARGGRLRGASTITQQVMKNFLLTSDRSAERKVKEIILASRIEETLGKEDILELYLNEIFLGQNSYGVAAAAQTYFNKTLPELTLEEAAYLAILPKAPSDYHPVRQAERAIDRRNFVLREMFENGYITRTEMEAGQGKAAADGAIRALSPVPRRPAGSRLLHRRDPPPADARLRGGGILHPGVHGARHGGREDAGRGGKRAAPRAGELRPGCGDLARHRPDDPGGDVSPKTPAGAKRCPGFPSRATSIWAAAGSRPS